MAFKDFAATLTSLLISGMEQLFGSGVQQPVIGAVTWADLGAVAIFLAFFLVVNAVAAGYLRHKSRQATEAAAEKKSLQPEGRAEGPQALAAPVPWPGKAQVFSHLAEMVDALGKPIYVLIWICGIDVAITPLLLKMTDAQGVHVIRHSVDRLFDIGVFATLFWLFFRLTHLLEARLTSLAAPSQHKLEALVIPILGKSLRIIVPVLGIIFGLPILELPPPYAGIVAKGSSILLIVAVALILFELTQLAEKIVVVKCDIKAADNLRARKIYTQLHFLSRTSCCVIVLFAGATILMLFDQVRQLGMSILASAGVAGVIIGFAAQKTLANLLAGLQLAMTQPMRLDDVLIVDGAWGRVEEITLTYVVIHVWDDTRLIVPLHYFIENPFQNWTRASAQLLGQVHVWADYSLPLDETRAALKEIVEHDPLWDGRFWNLQVVEASDKAMQLRVLATATDSSKAWDLRCNIREKLIAYLQEQHPRSLPRSRVELEGLTPLRDGAATYRNKGRQTFSKNA